MLNPKVTWKAGNQQSGELLLKASVIFLNKFREEIISRWTSNEPIFSLFIALDGGEEAVDKVNLEIEINTDKEGKIADIEICELRNGYDEQFGYRYSDATYAYKGALRHRRVSYSIRFKCENFHDAEDPANGYVPVVFTSLIEDIFLDSIFEAFRETSLFDC